MQGFSVFMDKDIDETTIAYIEQMARAGFTGIFTSLHIPEDDPNKYRERITKLGAIAKKNQLSLMVDVSGDALSKAGFSFNNLTELKKLGITGLRADDRVELKMIAKLTKELIVGLNASTMTKADITELKDLGADLSRLLAWHNYYPRPETGLDKNYFYEQNAFLKQNDLKVVAFIAGDTALRYPLYQGLPTLEAHRYLKPIVAYLELKNSNVDGIYLGDSGLTADAQKQFAHLLKEDRLLLRAKASSSYFSRVIGKHQNRKDVARDVIRSADARLKVSESIAPENTTFRPKGTITLDNCDYGRYMGELQLVKRDLKADPRVNVVGKVSDEDLDLLAYIGAGQKFEIVEDKR